MNAAGRRVVHKLAAETGIASDSVSEDHDRHIILKNVEEKTSISK
jgi:predicted RNA-binding protein Jag